MKKIFSILLLKITILGVGFTQKITWKNQEFEARNVIASLTQLNGEEVLKVERDLKAIPFDLKNLGSTVDEPTYVKLKNVNFDNGIIEVKMLSQIQNPSPFQGAQGFIGVAFRIDDQDKAYESIYLRPKVGRSDNQAFRNKTVQYYSYPDYKFDKLRKIAEGKYETTAPVNINEWITIRIEVNGVKASMFINDAQYSTFVVDTLKGKTASGGIGLWVDIATIGYFKDLKISSFPKKDLETQVQQNLKRAFQRPNVVNKIPYGNNPQTGKYVQTKDAKIYYEVYGKGQPIVLLHGGILGSTIEMAEFIDSLKSNFQVIAISTRGHGKSDIGTLPIIYEKKADDVMAVINAVTKENVILLGFSDGAYTGYKVASMYPNKIKKMIAIGAGEQIPGLRKVVFNSKELLSLDPSYWAQQMALMPQPERLQEFWTGMEIFYNTMTASKELFGSIKSPVLVLAGELDRNAPISTVINAYNMIPNSQLCIIPNTGHVCFLENFAAVWSSIIPFLK